MAHHLGGASRRGPGQERQVLQAPGRDGQRLPVGPPATERVSKIPTGPPVFSGVPQAAGSGQLHTVARRLWDEGGGLGHVLHTDAPRARVCRDDGATGACRKAEALTTGGGSGSQCSVAPRSRHHWGGKSWVGLDLGRGSGPGLAQRFLSDTFSHTE